MSTLRRRVDKLEVDVGRRKDVRAWTTAELEQYLIDTLGHAPNDDEMECLIDEPREQVREERDRAQA